MELIKKIRKEFSNKLQVGGGVRSLEVAELMLNELKVDRIVLGTIAITNFDLTKEIIAKHGADKVVLAIDAIEIDNKFIPKSNGWQENGSDCDLFALLEKYRNLAKYILCTDIAVDGTMTGPNLKLYQTIKANFSQFILQASGGVSSIDDINQLKECADFAIVGKALYGGLVES